MKEVAHFTTYLLVIEVDKDLKIKTRRREFFIPKGLYVYIGSGDIKRIERHLRKEKKKFWHIDFLLEHAKIKSILVGDIPEKELAMYLCKKYPYIEGFGSSDSPAPSHLIRIENIEELLRLGFYKLL